MTDPRQQPSWIAATVRALNENESWTGRIHIHKLLFIAKVLGLADPPFEFELYRYGPYSFELDERIAEMETYGFLYKEYPNPGYGPQYTLTPFGNQELNGFPDDCFKVVRRLASEVGGFWSGDIELAATCLWAEQCEGLDDDSEIVERVRRLKPKYEEYEIRAGLARARAIAQKVSG